MTFDRLSHPLESADGWLAGGLGGGGLVVVLVLAVLLGLRHATDPDHLVAVWAMVCGEGASPRAAARLGAWWGAGHAATLVVVGAPLILLDASLPGWLQSGAERAVGVVIVLLALRLLWRWAQRMRRPAHTLTTGAHGTAARVRTPATAAAIGVVHGLGGTGAIVLLLATGLPGTAQAVAALAVFAPMSVVSMAACTALFAVGMRGHGRAALADRLATPAVGGLALAFGGWYAGVL